MHRIRGRAMRFGRNRLGSRAAHTRCERHVPARGCQAAGRGAQNGILPRRRWLRDRSRFRLTIQGSAMSWQSTANVRLRARLHKESPDRVGASSEKSPSRGESGPHSGGGSGKVQSCTVSPGPSPGPLVGVQTAWVRAAENLRRRT
jgi:hypothetical protein